MNIDKMFFLVYFLQKFKYTFCRNSNMPGKDIRRSRPVMDSHFAVEVPMQILNPVVEASDQLQSRSTRRTHFSRPCAPQRLDGDENDVKDHRQQEPSILSEGIVI